MKRTIAAVLATLLMLLALACQQSNDNVDQLVDERIAAALAAIPTVTPQPTATPQTADPQLSRVSIENLEATIQSLAGRLETAESKLLTQDQEFRELLSSLDETGSEAVETSPLAGSIVTVAIESTSPSGRCWQYRVVSDGTGNTFLIEWEVLGVTEGLCFNPSSSCVKEVVIGAPVPRSCVG